MKKLNRVGNIDSFDGGIQGESLSNLKKELFPQTRGPPTAMIDPRNGNLLTNEDKILDAALYTYTKRPENKGQSETYKGSKRKIM